MFPLRRVLRLCTRNGECWFLQTRLCHRYNLSPMGIELIRGCVCRTRQPPIFLPSQRPPRGYGTAQQCCPRTTEVYCRLPPNRATKQTTVAYLRFWWFALLPGFGTTKASENFGDSIAGKSHNYFLMNWTASDSFKQCFNADHTTSRLRRYDNDHVLWHTLEDNKLYLSSSIHKRRVTLLYPLKIFSEHSKYLQTL